MIGFLKLLWLAVQWGPTIIAIVHEIIQLIRKLPNTDQGRKTLELSEIMNSERYGPELRLSRLKELRKDVKLAAARADKVS